MSSNTNSDAILSSIGATLAEQWTWVNALHPGMPPMRQLGVFVVAPGLHVGPFASAGDAVDWLRDAVGL